MPKKAENSQANTERTCAPGRSRSNADGNARHAERTCTPRRGRSKIVKSMPILKNNKIYRVGEEFPYTEKDKSLLWNLVEKPKENKNKNSEEKTNSNK